MSSFGTRDLALFLSDEVNQANSLGGDATADDKSKAFQPRQEQITKVSRYRAGQAPKWAETEAGGGGGGGEGEAPIEIILDRGPQVDRRLARLAASSSNNNNSSSSGSSSSSSSSSSGGRRRVYEAEVIVEEHQPRRRGRVNGDGDEEEEEDEEDEQQQQQPKKEEEEEEEEEAEESIAARRARVLQRMSNRQNEAAVEASSSSSSSSSSSKAAAVKQEESSEYETDSDDDSDDDEEEEEQTRLRPVFVPRNKRSTVESEEAKEREEAEWEAKRRVEKEERKKQTQTMVAETIRRNDEAKELDATDADSDAGLPDDHDDPDDVQEFEVWRLREIRRLKRDAETREQIGLEKADLERRRNLTDEERRAEDEVAGKFREKEKKKLKFLQKYYHKGAFYVDEDSLKANPNDVRARDYNEATGEDNFNFEAMPAVLQVKKFGFRSRTKYTHLADQDTTYKGTGLIKPDRHVQQKLMEKRGGMGGDLDGSRKKARL